MLSRSGSTQCHRSTQKHSKVGCLHQLLSAIVVFAVVQATCCHHCILCCKFSDLCSLKFFSGQLHFASFLLFTFLLLWLSIRCWEIPKLSPKFSPIEILLVLEIMEILTKRMEYHQSQMVCCRLTASCVPFGVGCLRKLI